jgi:hypothetical protein
MTERKWKPDPDKPTTLTIQLDDTGPGHLVVHADQAGRRIAVITIDIPKEGSIAGEVDISVFTDYKLPKWAIRQLVSSVQDMLETASVATEEQIEAMAEKISRGDKVH